MEYKLTEEAIKTLSTLPKDVQSRILDKLDFVFSSDNPLKFSKKLTNFTCGDYRIRIGDYRASFDIKGSYALFLRFGHRKNFYK
jgi:mRNA-degrading endonuclease RelE of RelBE toxin-antitoxin system